jgi:hypothetical protein
MQWAVVAAFYCAVHCMEAHFALRQIHFTSHYARQAEMSLSRSGVPTNVYDAYIELRQRCDVVRYYGGSVNSRTVQEKVLGKYLPAVTSFVTL